MSSVDRVEGLNPKGLRGAMPVRTALSAGAGLGRRWRPAAPFLVVQLPSVPPPGVGRAAFATTPWLAHNPRHRSFCTSTRRMESAGASRSIPKSIAARGSARSAFSSAAGTASCLISSANGAPMAGAHCPAAGCPGFCSSGSSRSCSGAIVQRHSHCQRPKG